MLNRLPFPSGDRIPTHAALGILLIASLNVRKKMNLLRRRKSHMTSLTARSERDYYGLLENCTCRDKR